MGLIRLATFLVAVTVITGFAFNQFPSLKDYTVNALIPENTYQKKLNTVNSKLADIKNNIEKIAVSKSTTEIRALLDDTALITSEASDITSSANQPQGFLEKGAATIGSLVNSAIGKSCPSK